jgi:hypothetical protein
MKLKKKILYGLLIVFIIIQFFRPARNSGSADSANDITHYTTVSPEVKSVLEASCYDCHSDHTNYPWYTNIQPVGWWMTNHINDGKRGLDFSQFNTYRITKKIRRFKGISNEVKEDEMPLNSYLWIHHDAKLNDAQKKLIMDWADENYKKLADQYPDSVIKR